MVNPALLEVNAVTYAYGAQPAVEDVSFRCFAGRTLGLFGPNGAGKTTTLMCAAGLLEPTAGSVAWAPDEPAASLDGFVSFVPETPVVFPWLTIGEHFRFIALARRLAKGWEREARILMSTFALDPYENAVGCSLSKGTKQKLLIASTILAGSRVLVFDEPMTGLDPLAQREFLAILGDLKKAGTGIIVSSHSLHDVANECDDVLVLKGGRVLEYGPVEDVMQRHELPFDQVFFRLTA